jgi:hypothetical protein
LNAQNWVEWTAIISPLVSSDGTPRKLRLLNTYNYFVDESGNKKTIAEAFKEQNSNIDEIPYAQVKSDNVDSFATKKSPLSDIRLSKH